MTTMLVVSAQAQTRLVVVTGIGGDPEYSDMFYQWAVTLIDAAVERHNVSADHVTFLSERVERDPQRIDDRSTKAVLEGTFTELASGVGRDETIYVVLIGHGSMQGEESRFNLPGPDATAQDFNEMLGSFTTQRVVFVNVSTASGGFVAALSGPNRTIVTATKTGFERNESIFGGHFVQAYAEDVADVDKDQRVSVLEAFNYAAQEVRRVYEADNRLLTEHALLDDNGDGEGSTEPSIDGPDGPLAATAFLDQAPGLVASATQDSTLARLYREKQDLEGQIAALRARREELGQTAYEAQLEELLVELALKDREIRNREGNN